MEKAIVVSGVKKSFTTLENKGTGIFGSLRRKRKIVNALKGVSFSVERSEIVALLGRNGSGKSTMIKTITGILHPDSGNVRVLGLDPWKERQELASHIGVVFGNTHPQLYWNLPPIDTFEYVRDVYGVEPSEYKKRLAYFTEILNISKVIKKPTRQLSLGERMKCEMVAALLHFPELVVMDEPTIGVDLPARIGIKNAVMRMRKDYGMTFLITTHVVDDIDMSDRIVMLDQGRKIFDGTQAKMKSVFSKYIILDLTFSEVGMEKSFKYRGSIIDIEPGHARLKIDPSMLKEAWIKNLITSSSVADYRISEPGLSSILEEFYKSNDHNQHKTSENDAE